MPPPRPRILETRTFDWAAKADTEYAMNKYITKTGFDYDDARSQTAASLAAMRDILLQVRDHVVESVICM